VAREKWYTIREAAEFLGISTVTLRRYIKNHRISAYQIAGRYRFKKSALNEFLEACRLMPRKHREHEKKKKSNRNNPTANPLPLEQTEHLADQILRVAPRQTRALYIKAFTASRLGRYGEAEEYYRKILKLRPQDSAAYLFLGLLYQEMQKLNLALEMWREVVNIDRSSDLAEVARYHITRALRAN
jgi:excisionase family DNA binding protein